MEARRGHAVISAINIPCTSSSSYPANFRLEQAPRQTIPLSNRMQHTRTHVCKFCWAADGSACAVFDFGLFTSRGANLPALSFLLLTYLETSFSVAGSQASLVVHLTADRRPHTCHCSLFSRPTSFVAQIEGEIATVSSFNPYWGWQLSHLICSSCCVRGR